MSAREKLVPISPHEDPREFWRRGQADIDRREATRIGLARSSLDSQHISFDAHIELHNLYRDVVLLATEQSESPCVIAVA